MASDETLTVSGALCQEWLKRMEYARDARKSFDTVADACHSFYSQSGKFMWEDKFRNRFLGNVNRPKFELTVNAAKEYVDIFGPYLFWDYPHRTAKAYEPLELDEELFGSDPWLQEMASQISEEQNMGQAVARQRARVMERYLNYTPREQPHGLWTHTNAAITEALVKGRGVMVPRAYSPPDSDRVLTGLFWEPVQNLLIDPDCTDCLLDTATFIAIRHETAQYDLEDRFNLPRGTLDDAAGIGETAESIVANDSGVDQLLRKNGKTNNVIVWFEIWSKCGVSCKKERQQSEFAKKVDSVVGDYVYMCVTSDVPWFLNAPPAAFTDDISDEDVSELLGWPFPSYKDSRWPVALLDFFPDPGSAWPIAPLSSGLGHLICLNVLMSAYVEQAYENRKSIIAVMEEAAKDVLDQINSDESPAIVRLKTDVAKDIKNVIQYLNRPNANTDILNAIDLVLRLFQKATGLVDFMYGQEAKVSRSAQDIVAKQEKTAIRPEKMSKDVAAWQAEGARLEALLATLEVQGEDVHPRIPSVLWDRLITNQDPELIWREMDIVIEATDVRRPNRERDLSQLQTLAQQSTAAFIQAAQMNGDWTPFNAFHKQIFKAMEAPWVPEMEIQSVDPNAQSEAQAQMEQMKAEAEQQKIQGELQKQQGELQKMQLELQGKQMDTQQKQMLLEFKGVGEAQKLQVDAAKATQSLEADALKSRQSLLFDELSHSQELRQDEEEHELALVHAEEMGEQKVRLAKKQAEAKPKPTSNGSASKK
jgi:hypothetical protein